jgi:hypothetical protein
VPGIEHTEITYATGPQASTNIEESELKSLKEEYADYEANFIVTNVLNKVVSELAKKANISGFVDAAKTAVGFDSGKKEMEGDIKVEEALKVADRLNLEMAVSERQRGKELNIQFYPLDGTFEKMERWKELHKENPDLYFPDQEINSHDWYAIGYELKKIQLDFGSKTYAYIYDGSKNGESIRVLAKGEK